MLLKDKRIFIVEDNLENRVIMQIILTRQGAKLEFDRWGRDSVRRLKAFKPVDLIILDLMLGMGVTGYQIFDEIRAAPEFAGVPVVAVSASDPSQAIPMTKKKGFAGFIAKPVDDDLFPEQLAKIMNAGQVWSSG